VNSHLWACGAPKLRQGKRGPASFARAAKLEPVPQSAAQRKAVPAQGVVALRRQGFNETPDRFLLLRAQVPDQVLDGCDCSGIRDSFSMLLKKQIRRDMKELSQLADVRFAGLALAGQYLGRNASGTEDRQQVGLTEAAMLHQERNHFVRRHVGEE